MRIAIAASSDFYCRDGTVAHSALRAALCGAPEQAQASSLCRTLQRAGWAEARSFQMSSSIPFAEETSSSKAGRGRKPPLLTGPKHSEGL